MEPLAINAVFRIDGGKRDMASRKVLKVKGST